MTKSVVYIIGSEKFNRLKLPSEQKTVKHDGITYKLLPHKKLKRRRSQVWLFKKGKTTPIDISELKRSQKYKKITPSALKIVVSQNIEHTFFKSLIEKRGFAGIGRRRMIALFVAVGVAIVALKVLGYY